MTIEKLERVMWRLRHNYEDLANTKKIPNGVLHEAMMKEVGTDIRTYRANRKALIKMGWIKSVGKYAIKLTDKDITES